jgi:cell wall-associated NlpC family hydrolase
LLAGLVITLVGVTANSSAAARGSKRDEQKNHSTSNKKKTHSTQEENAKRLAALRTHATTPEREAAIRRILESRSEGASQAPVVDKQDLSAAQTPRGLGKVEDTRKSSPSLQVPTEDNAVREALARRREWTEPRQNVLQPAKVKDPPAVAAKPVDVPAQPVQMARNVSDTPENEDIIREALSRRGTPYVWGGASRGGFDCSGFVCYVFAKQRGMKLPHSASAQATLGAPVGKDQLQPGDLVFFATYRPSISHVGIYVGDGKFVHAANSRKGCRVDALSSSYYSKRYRGARRYTAKRFTPEEFKPYMENSSELPPSE